VGCFFVSGGAGAGAGPGGGPGLGGLDREPSDCYYNFQRYAEGDRIVTNEPCLNCTCHSRMLMCYLRVCPFSKAIGQDCKVEKRPDQCCPVITCPEGQFILFRLLCIRIVPFFST